MNARHRRLDGTQRARIILAMAVGCGTLTLIPVVPSHAQFIQQGTKLVGTGAIGHAKQGGGVALSADGNTAIVGGAADDGDKGAAWIYRRVGDIWVEQTKLIGSSAVGNAGQGIRVDLSADGNTAIIGGPNDNGQTGAAWVFVFTAGGWNQQAKLVGTGASGPAQQGWSVSLSGDGNTALVGGPVDDDVLATGYGIGAAWVFTRSAGVWSQQGPKLVGTPNAPEISQGASVSLSGNGDVAIIGGPYDVTTGAAWVFHRSAGVWTQDSKLVGSSASAYSYQGQSVAMSADGMTAMVGGMYDEFDGAAWAFTWSGGSWPQQGPKLTQADGGGPSTFGSQGQSVSLSGDGNTAVVGAGYVANVSVVGGAWVYTRSGAVWSPLGPKLVGSGAGGMSGQGWDCALSEDGNTLIVGGLDDDSGDGAAWVFVRSLPPQDLSIHPSQGGVNQVVTASISATGILDGAAVHLARTGQPNIVGSDVSVGADGLSLTASFDLSGAAAGVWDVVVTNPFAQSSTLPSSFIVAAVAAPQLRIYAIGPALIRANRRVAYDLVIDNPGNVDAVGVPLWITGVPTDATLELDFQLTAPPQDGAEPDWSTVPLTFTSPGGRYAPIVIPSVPPGTTVRRIYLTIPPSDPTFVLRAALTPPWVDGNKFRACLANGGISDPVCMGAQLTAINAFLAATPGIDALSGIGVWAKIAWQCESARPLPVSLTKAEQILDFMESPLEPGGSAITACSDVLPPRWRDSLLVTIVSSYDPNDKLGAQGTLPLQQAIPYSIRFENASTATAPAQQVVVSDPLNTALVDPATVSLDAITFGSIRIVPPPGLRSYATQVDLRPAKNLLVNVSAAVDLFTGVLSWYFSSIDPATGQPPINPLAGFLPANATPPEGEGSVLFTVMPRPGLAGGAQISNGASITFDENAPHLTPNWINTVDNTPPPSQVMPMPANSDQPSVPVSWSAAGGTADLRDFTVYVSEDGAPYRVWRLNTTATSDTLVPARNFKPHMYNFYSVARDMSGNIEAAPAGADATTLTRTGVEVRAPLQLALAGAMPNPARGEVRASITLANAAPATLELMDVAGRRVYQREVGTLGPGPHVVPIAPRPQLRAGLYFLRLSQGPQVLHARVALIE
jgi:hypothetical protein